MKSLKRLLLAPFSWLAALVFLIEETLWDMTAALMAKLGAVRVIHLLENHLTSLAPRWALFTFLLPSIILIPAKLLGLHAIAAGHWLIGSSVFVIAKLLGMALFSRIFNLTRPALMQLAWFAQLYAKVMHYRNRIHVYLANWAAYQQVKRQVLDWVTNIKAKFRRRKE